MATDKQNLPSTPRAEYVAAQPDVQLIRDLLAGTRRMHEKYATYIPKWKAEKPDNYRKRATAAKVYGGLSRALSASVGMLFAKPPKRSETWTPEITGHWENIDGKGTHGNVFAKRQAEHGLADGFVAILVDHPQAPAGVTVHAGNEQALNLRPIWAAYQRLDILNWVTATVDNVETLVQVTLCDGGTTRVGAFGVKNVLLYRICTLQVIPGETPELPPTRMAQWRLVEEVKQSNGDTVLKELSKGVFLDAHGVPFTEIPLAIGYTGRTNGAFCAHPPLLDLAWCNLEHWQVANDLRYYEKLCAYPQPVIKGDLAPTGLVSSSGAPVPPSVQLGPNVLVHLKAGSEFGFEELTGSSLAELRNSLQEKKDEMGELGASFLAKKTRGVETAEAKRLDAIAENSSLATAGQGIADMFNQALVYHARYLGIPAEQAPSITINHDFDTQILEADVMNAYVAAVKEGYPKRLVLEAFQMGGRIPADADLEALELEWESGVQAAMDQQVIAALTKPDPTVATP